MRKSQKFAKDIFSENNGILRSSQARYSGINPKTLSDMVDSGLVVKESRGLYRLSDLEPPGNPDLVYVSHKVPRAVICLVSALSFYGMTTQIPHKVHIALPSKSRNEPKVEYPPLEVFWLNDASFNAGVEHQKIDEFVVRIYGREKTIADCFKFRNKVGLDLAIEALKSYMAERSRDINALMKYARINRVERVLRPYVEALV